ncbi:MAG: hypothetical protein ACRDMZ_15850, partial [Solirubrobacteraceae bacterium]
MAGRGARGGVLAAMLAALALPPPPAFAVPPQIITGAATAVTGTQATLHATVTTDGSPLRCWFEYHEKNQGVPDATTKELCADGAFEQ